MSTRKEFDDIINKGVRRKTKRTNISPNRGPIESKWVFKKKIYGQFRARLVAQG